MKGQDAMFAGISASRRVRSGLIVGACGLALLVGCLGTQDGGKVDSETSASHRRFPLDTLPTTQITVDGHVIRVWLALTPAEHEEGLMWVSPDEIADDQGMLFVFSDERLRSFWMKNTITPLDIAYARMNGTVVSTWQMPPETLTSFPSIEPAMFALEMKQGAFDRYGINAGDRIEVPAEVFKTRP